MLENQESWRIEAVRDSTLFLAHLPLLVPEQSTLFLEGTTEKAVERYLKARPAPNPTKVAVATVWPRPDIHHLAITPENIDRLGLKDNLVALD